jgi:hypothetical protein
LVVVYSDVNQKLENFNQLGVVMVIIYPAQVRIISGSIPDLVKLKKIKSVFKHHTHLGVRPSKDSES